MRESDKFQSDLASWEAKAPANPDSKSLERLRSLFFRCSGGLPENLLSDVFTDFLERWGTGAPTERADAIRWLSGAAGLFSGEADCPQFSRDDWVAIREVVSANADEMPLDLLTEILSRVLDARAID
jgi:hypothetical protein